MQGVLFALLSLWIFSEVEPISIPTGRCIKPIPKYPGLDFSKVEGQVYKYVYTPDVSVFKYMDSIAMFIKHEGNNIYSEIFNAHTVFGTTTKLNFNLEYLGDGVLKMKPKKGGLPYTASIVAVSEDESVGLLYVCSEKGKKGQDMLYVIARTEVDVDKVEHPNILFKDVKEQYKFKSIFKKLPVKRQQSKTSISKQHWYKK